MGFLEMAKGPENPGTLTLSLQETASTPSFFPLSQNDQLGLILVSGSIQSMKP